MGASQLKVLRQLIGQHFDEEEFRTLCFDLGVDYDSLRGEGKAAKIRELIGLMNRHCRLEELVAEVCEVRPNLAPILDAFQEYTLQINQLHDELDEWKKLHNALHDLHSKSATCTGFAITLGKIGSPTKVNQHQRDMLIYVIEVNWKSCKRVVDGDIKKLAESVKWISQPYNANTGDGPEWFLKLDELSDDIDSVFKEDAVLKTNLSELSEHIPIFDGIVDDWLFLADKNLKKVVEQITQLPRLSFQV